RVDGSDDLRHGSLRMHHYGLGDYVGRYGNHHVVEFAGQHSGADRQRRSHAARSIAHRRHQASLDDADRLCEHIGVRIRHDRRESGGGGRLSQSRGVLRGVHAMSARAEKSRNFIRLRSMRLLVLAFLSLPAVFGAWDGHMLLQTVPEKAGGAPTAPYTLLISGNFPELAAVSAGGHVANTVTCGVNSLTCPADLIFARDSQCTVPYAGWDILGYSGTTGQLTAMVEIPLLSDIRPSKVYICAGNPQISTFQGGGRGAAYDNNYLLAMHMDEISGTVLHDSTANANDAVKKSATAPSPNAAAKLGGGQRFTGTRNSTNNDYARFQTDTAATSTYTMEYWSNATSYVNQDAVFLAPHNASGQVIYTGFYWFPSGTILFRNSWGGSTPAAAAAASTGTFHNIVFVRDNDTMNVYLDGVPGTVATGFGTGG